MRSVKLAAALLAVSTTAPLIAQQCRNPLPDLGVRLDCRNCDINITRYGRDVSFGTEPRVVSVRDGGPAEGRIRRGDYLVAIGGSPITSDAASRRIYELRAGRAVELTVRRNDRMENVSVVPVERCHDEMFPPPIPPAPPAPPRAPVPPRPPRAPHAPTPPTPPTPVAPVAPVAPVPPMPPVPPTPPAPPVPPTPPQLSRAYFGFSISCEQCEMVTRNGQWRFTFRSPPELSSVEPGTPADRAGFERGDRLTHIDGMELTSTQGARRFANVEPGETVTFTYRRGSAVRTARAVAARRPERGPRAPVAAGGGQRLRFSGAVGDTQVEVRGAPVTVTRDPATGELLIRSAETTVRIRPDRH